MFIRPFMLLATQWNGLRYCKWFKYSRLHRTCTLTKADTNRTNSGSQFQNECFAYFSYLTHSMEITHSLDESTMHELCSDWQGPVCCFLSMGNLYFTSEHTFRDLDYATVCSIFTNSLEIELMRFKFLYCTLKCSLTETYASSRGDFTEHLMLI